MRTYSVYKHTSPDGKVYIGITCLKPERRWRNGNGYYQNTYFMNAIKKYGWDSIIHEIVIDGITKEDACKEEQRLIKEYRSNEREHGYNHSIGGETPSLGFKFSAESKEKARISQLGKRRTEKTKKKISAAKKGKPNGHEGKTGIQCMKSKLILQIDENTGEILNTFYGYSEIVRLTGFKKTPVREAAIGIRKRAYGYKWAQMERGDNVVPV